MSKTHWASGARGHRGRLGNGPQIFWEGLSISSILVLDFFTATYSLLKWVPFLLKVIVTGACVVLSLKWVDAFVTVGNDIGFAFGLSM